MTKSHWEKGTSSQSERLFLTERQSDNCERSETADITKINPWGDVISENLQWWVTHDSENICCLVLKALDQRNFNKAQIQNLKEQNNQKDSQIEELTAEKQKLKQNVLKLTQ